MSRMLTISIAVLVLVGSILAIRYTGVSNKPAPSEDTNLLNADSSNFQNWREFEQPEGSFKALFPMLPQHVTDNINDPVTKEPRKYDMYAAAGDRGAGFIISTITFPSKVEDSESDALLRGAVNDVVKRNTDNKLKMTKPGKFHNFKSLDFALENKDVMIAGKAILSHNTLYVLSMADKIKDFKTDELNFFVNSFSIVDKSDSTKAAKKLPNSSLKQLQHKANNTSQKKE